MSIDTEGSEYAILRAFDFSAYDIRVITVEHNYGKNRGPIRALLMSAGYELKHSDHSLYEDWFVKCA